MTTENIRKTDEMKNENGRMEVFDKIKEKEGG